MPKRNADNASQWRETFPLLRSIGLATHPRRVPGGCGTPWPARRRPESTGSNRRGRRACTSAPDGEHERARLDQMVNVSVHVCTGWRARACTFGQDGERPCTFAPVGERPHARLDRMANARARLHRMANGRGARAARHLHRSIESFDDDSVTRSEVKPRLARGRGRRSPSGANVRPRSPSGPNVPRPSRAAPYPLHRRLARGPLARAPCHQLARRAAGGVCVCVGRRCRARLDGGL